jgi:AcrR family transcriptional regulator
MNPENTVLPLDPAEVPHAEAVRQRIMDAGEKLFADFGFTATSLRQITAEAGVNVAAVNYYFGSKENLYHTIIVRGTAPIMVRRFELLGQHEQRAGDRSLTLEEIFDAFFRPCFEFVKGDDRLPFLRLMGKSMYESDELMQKLLENEWQPVMERFFAAYLKCVPEMAPADAVWVFHFAIGALIHAVSQYRLLEKTTKGLCTFGDGEWVLAQLVSFCSAGVRARASEMKEGEFL